MMTEDSQVNSAAATQDDQQTSSGRRPGSGRRRCWFRLAAVLIGVLPFLVLEAALRIFGIAAPDRDDDLLVGYSQIEPLFDLDETDAVYRTRRSRELFFGTQEFAAVKPDNGFRIFCLGGSTVRGRPYETDSAFPKWLEMELAACDPSRTYEAVNCGGLSYASYRLRVLLDEVLKYEPDLIVVATGHNEFLEDRTYASLRGRSSIRVLIDETSRTLHSLRLARQLLEGSSNGQPGTVESNGGASAGSGSKTDHQGRTLLDEQVLTRLDDPTGYASYRRDPEWRSGVVQHFGISIKAMIERCRTAGVPLLLVNLGSNLRDTAPFKSEYSRELSPEDELKWQQAFEAGSLIGPARSTTEGARSTVGGIRSVEQAEQALGHFRVAEAIDAGHALLLYRIARCLDRLNKFDEARSYYLRAKDEDVCPLRMIDELNALQTEIAVETETPIVDVRAMFESTSPQSIPGHDWFTDHVHPTIYGHQKMASAIADRLREHGVLSNLGRWIDDDRRAAYTRWLGQLGPTFLINGRRRVGWLEGWAQRNRLYDETLPIDPRGFLHSGFRKIGFGETEAAWLDFRVALESEPAISADLLRFAQELDDQGRSEAARELRESHKADSMNLGQ